MKWFSKLRHTVPFVVSLIALIWVCSYEFRSTSYENELWFGLLVIVILILCLLFMYWGMGGITPETSKKRKTYVYRCKTSRSSFLCLPYLAQCFIGAGYSHADLLINESAFENADIQFLSRKNKRSIDFVCIMDADLITANMSSQLSLLIKGLADSEMDRADYFCCIIVFLSSSSAQVAERTVLQNHRYGVAHGTSNMIISCHINPNTGLLHISPPSSVGYTLWRKTKRMICNMIEN